MKVRVKADASGVDMANVEVAINPFNEIAVEQAVHFKEAGTASEIIVVSSGVAVCQERFRNAPAIGAGARNEKQMETSWIG